MRTPREARRFRCHGCGRSIPPGQAVALAGVRVARRRRRFVADGVWSYGTVLVTATPSYPARVCPRCAEPLSRFHVKPAGG